MEIQMKHIPGEEWIDFVRQVVHTPKEGKDEKSIWSKDAELLQNCLAMAASAGRQQRTKKNYGPPGDGVRIAKASLGVTT